MSTSKQRQKWRENKQNWRDNNRNSGSLQYFNERARYLNKRVKHHYGIDETITGLQLISLYRSVNGRCYLCGDKVKPSEVHFDHKHSLKNGGAHNISNIGIGCGKCNHIKSERSLDEFLQVVFDQGHPQKIFEHLYGRNNDDK